MRWRDARRSRNVEDYRGGGGGGGLGRLGLGGVAAVVVISLLLGKNPIEMLALVSGLAGGGPTTTQSAEPSADNQQNREFVSAILGETEDVWGAIFQTNGAQYQQPRLVLFSGAVQTACGGASSASGPFYCPGDQRVYLDTGFFEEMHARLGGGGDFAEAYVIAHEVGHHVQTLTGVSAQVSEARRAGREVGGDGGLLVRQELQADCYAGLWAHQAQQRHQWLEPGDIEEALNTASAIGDDRLQKQVQGTVVPDAFTHGTAEQRVRWFKRGFISGAMADCDTFAARGL
ncbi:MAG: neutral zinc metallopeptidase [Nevskiaceae bacterium]|nr:MAG: neutral zinc metallopeptidase [Nevskiaceae bacterium]